MTADCFMNYCIFMKKSKTVTFLNYSTTYLLDGHYAWVTHFRKTINRLSNINNFQSVRMGDNCINT